MNYDVKINVKINTRQSIMFSLEFITYYNSENHCMLTYMSIKYMLL